MADPGTLIPSDAVGPQVEYEETFFAVSPFLRDVDYTHIASSSSGVVSSIGEYSESEKLDRSSKSDNLITRESELDNSGTINEPENKKELCSQESMSNPEKCEVESKLSEDKFSVEKALVRELPGRPNHPFTHARSPSWTEGVSSPAVRRMKVKDVSQYMIDAAKENPNLAQKLHDVLLESGVVAPANLFSEIYTEQREASMLESRQKIEDRDQETNSKNGLRREGEAELGPGQFSPPLPYYEKQSKASPVVDELGLKPVEGLIVNYPGYFDQVTRLPAVVVSAAATEAVVASSVVGAAVKSGTDLDVEASVAAAAASRQSKHVVHLPNEPSCFHQNCGVQNDNNSGVSGSEPQGSGDREHVAVPEAERSSDRSAGDESTKSDIALDDVAEWEIPWEEIKLGERIGLGKDLLCVIVILSSTSC